MGGEGRTVGLFPVGWRWHSTPVTEKPGGGERAPHNRAPPAHLRHRLAFRGPLMHCFTSGRTLAAFLGASFCIYAGPFEAL